MYLYIYIYISVVALTVITITLALVKFTLSFTVLVKINLSFTIFSWFLNIFHWWIFLEYILLIVFLFFSGSGQQSGNVLWSQEAKGCLYSKSEYYMLNIYMSVMVVLLLFTIFWLTDISKSYRGGKGTWESQQKGMVS